MEYKSTEAKNRFGEVLSRAFEEGPQTIRRHGRKAILMSQEDFVALKGKARGPTQNRDQIDPLLNGPIIGDDMAALFEREAADDRHLTAFF